MRRGAWSAAAGVVVALFGTTAITWLVDFKAAGLPLWPFFVFVAVTTGGFYGMLAPLRNWPPFEPELAEVPEEHCEQLRNIARTLHDQISREEYPVYSEANRDSGFLESVFTAHYPHIHKLVATFFEQTSQWKIARGQYLLDAGREMLERFDEGDGWDLEQLKVCFRAHLWGIAEGTRPPDLEEDDRRKAVTWDGKVVFSTQLEPSLELFHALTSAAIAVRDWADAATGSEEAEVMRTIRPASKQAAFAALSALEPVIQHQRISPASGCTICNP